MQLVMTLSKLLFGAFMLLGGLLGDTYGRRRVLVFGCAGIVGASALAALLGVGGPARGRPRPRRARERGGGPARRSRS